MRWQFCIISFVLSVPVPGTAIDELTMRVSPFAARLCLVVLACQGTTGFIPVTNTDSTFKLSAQQQEPSVPTVVAGGAGDGRPRRRRGRSRLFSVNESTEAAKATPLDVDTAVSEKFKVLTCTSTACSQKRGALGMDEYSTFSAFWGRSQDRAPSVQVEESPCLGSCKKAPCVGIVHEDFDGSVALEGMSETEFDSRVFHHVVSEADADRVWSCVENAILVMAQEEDSDEGDDEDNDNNS
jgi:hypothetical protein